MDKMVKEFKSACERFHIAWQAEMEEDFLAASTIYGVTALEYFQFEFWGRNDAGRREFIADAERLILFRRFYDFSRYEIVRNKWLQYKFLKKYFKRDCILIDANSSESADFDFFLGFIQEGKDYIFKPTRCSCGEGVRKIRIAAKEEDCIRKIYEKLRQDGGIFEPYVAQVPELAKFHQQSVNTVRLIVLQDDLGENHYLRSLFRMGKGDLIVDNSESALRALMDPATGIVSSPGVDSYGNSYSIHPDTGEQIVGFVVPRYEELLQVADEIMEVLSDIARYIGFDFALTEKGWIILEVNPFPQLIMQQFIPRTGYKREVLELLENQMGIEDSKLREK